MRSLALVVALLSACELTPPPPKKAPKAAQQADVGSAAGSAAGSDVPQATGSAAAPVGSAGSAAGSAAPAAPAADAAAGSGSAGSAAVEPPPPDVAAACTEVANHLTDVAIKSIADPQDRARLEQNRTRAVRKAVESCVKARYSAETRSCMLSATTQAAVKACAGPTAPPPPRPDPKDPTPR